MTLMFNKETLEGHWFKAGEDSTGWTERVPPYTNYVFDEGLGDWVLSEIVEDEVEGD